MSYYFAHGCLLQLWLHGEDPIEAVVVRGVPGEDVRMGEFVLVIGAFEGFVVVMAVDLEVALPDKLGEEQIFTLLSNLSNCYSLWHRQRYFHFLLQFDITNLIHQLPAICHYLLFLLLDFLLVK